MKGSYDSPRTEKSIPLGDRRMEVYTKVREQLASNEYGAVERIVKMAMKAGQGSATVCRLAAERDYTFSGVQDRNLSPTRRSVTALEKQSVELRQGCFWRLREPWERLANWLKHEQGLEWDLSFIVIGYDQFRTPVEAEYADLLVSWPPFTSAEAGRTRGPLMEYWENNCIRKTVNVSDGVTRWKALFKNALACGQGSAIIQTVYLSHDFSLVRQDDVASKHPDLVCVHGARCWLSNARIPDNAIEENAQWVMEPRYKAMIEWIHSEKLSWYLVFDVEIDPTSKISLATAQLKRLKGLFSKHMDEETRSITLDRSEKFLLEALTLEPLPMSYRLSKWAYLVITDYPIKKLGAIQSI